MERKCQGCRVRVRLRDKGGKPGATIRFTCPRCGDLNATTIPGNQLTDDIIASADQVLDDVARILGPDWRETYGAPRTQA